MTATNARPDDPADADDSGARSRDTRLPVVRFLNRNLRQKRSGIENAALLRIRAFETELGIVPQYLTVDYDPGFALTRAELIASGHVSRQVVFQNLYDYFQEIDTHGHGDVRVELPRNDEWTYVPVPDTDDLKVYGRNQRLLMYVKCSSRDGSVDYINHFHDGRKWRRDTYTPQGRLSRIQYRDIETGEFVNEHYLRPDGSVALIQLFTNQDGRRTLSRVSLMSREGYCVEDFTSQQDLIAYWLDQLTSDPDTHYVLVSDRNQPYYRPLKGLKMLPGKDNVSVVSIIHSVHVKDALDIHSSRTKFTYAEVLDDIRAPDAVVVGTPSQRRDILRRYGQGNLHVIPHAYSQAAAPPDLGFGQRNRKEVVCLGRYQAEKNQQVAIRAFASVVRAVPDATLQLYGAGSQKSALIDLVASLGLQDSVFVNDYASDVTAIYRSAGLSVLTSKEEGYPLVLVESLSQGCPVVSFDVNYGPSDLIEHGETGFLVPPGDEQALAQRICEVLENPELHERLSANALASSQAFGVDVVADRWRRLIGGLVEGQATRHRGAADDGAPAEVLHAIRRALVDPAHELTIADDLLPGFDPEISQIYITLFQRGLSPIRWGSRRSDLQKSLARNVAKIRANKRFKDFNPADPAACRILVEWVTDEYPVAIKDVATNRFDDHRFEPGITGFRFNHEGQTYHYMPTDAVTKSHMTLKHALNDMSKKCGIAKETDRISKRAKLMKSREICYWMTNSEAIVTDGTDADTPLALYRGYPVPVPEPSDDVLAEAVYAGADWVVDNMAEDGSFLYYYEGIKDTVVDHEHPRMIDPLYYNMLRHGGGTLLLLRAYELGNDPRYLDAARRSLDYLQTTCRTHDVDGERAVHVICNRKSKLGGTGIALSALMHYVRLSGDSGMRDLIVGMVRHLLSRVDDTGEMIGYYIHPQYCEGKPILAPDAETKRKLFSFYYPGEALLGLALYCRHFPDADEALVTNVKETARRALDFLVHERPKRYPDLFTALPSDGWLMQAIEEWFRFAEFRDDSYKGFVYSDADAMLQHMYTAQNSPYLDYPGGYFYDHGDHVYTDGARSEGLVAAYFLARDLGDEAETQRFGDGCRLAARNLLFTANTRASLYAHRFPEKSLGSFRFKLTRQWVRIDSAQHVVCFFARLAGAGSSTAAPGRSVSR